MALSGHLMADPAWAIDEDDAQALADEIVSQLARGVDLAYRLLSVSAANIASVPSMYGADGERSIRSYLGDPDVQVVYDPLGLLDQISSPEAADLILDLFERAPNRAMYLHAVWLATQMMVRSNFDERQRARLGVLVLARWRADPEQAPRDLAQLIAVLPAGFREAFSRAAAQGGNTDFGYVLEHGEDVSAADAERMASRIVDAVHRRHPGGVEADRVELESLVREGLFHRESERRHLAAVVLSASPYAHHVGRGRPRPAQRAGHRLAGAGPDGDDVQLPRRRRAPAPAEPVRRGHRRDRGRRDHAHLRPPRVRLHLRPDAAAHHPDVRRLAGPLAHVRPGDDRLARPRRDRQLVRGAGLAAPGRTVVAAGRPGDPLKRRLLLARVARSSRTEVEKQRMALESAERPWGSWHVLDEGDGYKVKRINVHPGQRLSYQTHEHRSEHWVVIAGTATCVLDGETIERHEGQSIDVATGAAHRIINAHDDELVIIEVQRGAYTGEDDIVRLEDDYGRQEA